MSIRQLSVFTENKPGALAVVVNALHNASVDIRAMSIADTQDFGILRLIVSDTEQAKQALTQAECLITETPVVAVPVADSPGALRDIIALLSEHGVNLDYLYAFLTPAKGNACVVLKVEHPEEVEHILSENGQWVLTEHCMNVMLGGE